MSEPTNGQFTIVPGRGKIPRAIGELQRSVRSAGLLTDGDMDTSVTTRGTASRPRRKFTNTVQQAVGSTIPRWG